MTHNSTAAEKPRDSTGYAADSAQWIRELRLRAEDAVAASVHHASLSQQYLSLSQKFAALAEQVSGHSSQHLAQLVHLLDTEARTGQPAPPWCFPWGTYPQPGTFPPTHVVERGATQPAHAAADLFTPRVAPPAVAPPAVPSSDVASTVTSTEFLRAQSNDGDLNSQDEVGAVEALLQSADAPAEAARWQGNQAPVPGSTGTAEHSEAPVVATTSEATRPKGKPRRKVKRTRDLAERLRMMAPRILERVRVRARKSDLKPRPRTATEEIQKNRRPVAASSALCGLVIAVMAWLQQEIEIEPPVPPLIAAMADAVNPVEESLPVEPAAELPGDQQEQPAETVPEEPAESMPPEPPPEPEPPAEPPPPQDPPEPSLPDEPPPDADAPADKKPEPPSRKERREQLAQNRARAMETVTAGRSAAGRAAMLQKYGGSAASESAVQRALEWLAARQRRDGSWDFNDVGPCTMAGTVNNPIGATSYALLPFLAAGQTHRDRSSTYRTVVEAGLSSLISNGIATPAGLDLRGVLNKGNRDKEPNEAYYVHGAATLALCEAFAMTRDHRLKAPAEGAVQFLVNSQDPHGGGWRYVPQQPGSTSVTAIQVMALAAASKAGIAVPQTTFDGVMHYLDTVQVDQAGRYGYEIQKKQYQGSVTAMALLSRIYLGWGRNDGDLSSGVMLLDKRGPYENFYYNYFATQVMRNWGGAEWERWNARLRDDLIAWQEQTGDAAGSWAPRDRDDYSRAGGRLLTTCLATLTLEVYYRYQPLLPE